MIHSTAIIDASAEIGEGVTIGPYSVIGADVKIGDRCEIGPHVVINGPTSIGSETKIFQFASLGDAPQDKKYAGEPTRLEIGERNVIREYCTFNRGTAQDTGVTKIGNDNWIMAYCHIAHDCDVGDRTIFANNAQIAGHVAVGDHAILGAFTVVHQFVSIGAYSFTGMGTILTKDLLPYVMANGNLAKPYGLNSEGMKRLGYSSETMSNLKKAYRIIYRSSLTTQQALVELQPIAAKEPEVKRMSDFLENASRGIIR